MLCHIKPWWYDSQPPFVTILYGEALLYCSCRSFNRRTSRKWFCCGFCCCLKSQFRIIVFLNVICLLSQHRFPPLIVSFGKRIFLCKGRNQIVVFSFQPTLIRAQAWCCEYQESSRHVERMMLKLNGTFSYNQWKVRIMEIASVMRQMRHHRFFHTFPSSLFMSLYIKLVQ